MINARYEWRKGKYKLIYLRKRKALKVKSFKAGKYVKRFGCFSLLSEWIETPSPYHNN